MAQFPKFKKTRKFNGQTMHFEYAGNSKRSAINEAGRYRRSGYNARVIKRKDKLGSFYVVYIRRGNKRRNTYRRK